MKKILALLASLIMMLTSVGATTLQPTGEMLVGWEEVKRITDPYNPSRQVTATYRETKDIMQFNVGGLRCDAINGAELNLFFYSVAMREYPESRDLTFSRVVGNPMNRWGGVYVPILNGLPRVQTKTVNFPSDTTWTQVDMLAEVLAARASGGLLTLEISKTSAPYLHAPDDGWKQGNAVIGVEDFYNISGGNYYDTAYWVPSWDASRFNPARYENNKPYLDIDCYVAPPPPPPDTDGDGIADPDDNCPLDVNPGQEDVDNDDIGDACDTFTDVDRDGVEDGVDNCPNKYNPDQTDSDNDGKGNKCDSTPYPRRSRRRYCSWYYRWKGWC